MVLVLHILTITVISVASSSAEDDFFMSSYNPNGTRSVDEGNSFDLWCNADRDGLQFHAD